MDLQDAHDGVWQRGFGRERAWGESKKNRSGKSQRMEREMTMHGRNSFSGQIWDAGLASRASFAA
ncbi:MAG: hypothetical protein BWZ10_01363 [candidate division BRC1 bacterium ADurb.BinA364]|nr:MAG: hypothetical protein BWZ10_01363 [candidate division BRC1 bacterium ADurb.BinA364]